MSFVHIKSSKFLTIVTSCSPYQTWHKVHANDILSIHKEVFEDIDEEIRNLFDSSLDDSVISDINYDWAGIRDDSDLVAHGTLLNNLIQQVTF